MSSQRLSIQFIGSKIAKKSADPINIFKKNKL